MQSSMIRMKLNGEIKRSSKIVLLHHWFCTGSGIGFPSSRHSAMSRYIFGCHKWRAGVCHGHLLREIKLGILLTIFLHRTDTSSCNENCLAKKVSFVNIMKICGTLTIQGTKDTFLKAKFYYFCDIFCHLWELCDFWQWIEYMISKSVRQKETPIL
jgi:hypothetical protein